MEPSIITEVGAIKVKEGKSTPISDTVVLEYPFTLHINGEQYVTLVCSPQHLEEMVYGLLFSDNIIHGMEDVEDLSVVQDKGLARIQLRDRLDDRKKHRGRRVITSGCGKSTVFYNVEDLVTQRPIRSDVTVTPEVIQEIMKAFDKSSGIYFSTGGTHSCALCKEDAILFFASDIGRHNALDKCVGYLLKNAIEPDGCYVVSSGRLSSEMVYKCMRAGIGVVASRSATTKLAIEVADQVGMTLIGFVRGRRMNVYTHPERICLEGAVPEGSDEA